MSGRNPASDSASDIYVEHAKIEAAAGHLRAHKKSFDDILSTLEGDLAPMVATWSGEARDLYLTKKRNWDRAAADLTALLAHIATITETAHNTYTATVTEVGEMWV
ncbi:WXG100 family type VII secretion target [uncultured Jatrophihabitans sp.]|uniref:WXG100 family type VII secretion target n=1 Tax=uncultured Jatrophihabitans sp. TaxID=1610747 RepID=UPI0035C981AC